MTKGGMTLKCIQLCAVIYFSRHILSKKCSRDLITELLGEQIEPRTRMFVVHRLEPFLLHRASII